MSKEKAIPKYAFSVFKAASAVSAVLGHGAAYSIASAFHVKIPQGAVRYYAKIQMKEAEKLWNEAEDEWNKD